VAGRPQVTGQIEHRGEVDAVVVPMTKDHFLVGRLVQQDNTASPRRKERGRK
jgi:hypothetical protein